MEDNVKKDQTSPASSPDKKPAQGSQTGQGQSNDQSNKSGQQGQHDQERKQA